MHLKSFYYSLVNFLLGFVEEVRIGTFSFVFLSCSLSNWKICHLTKTTMLSQTTIN